jgi:hypothetical protein
LSSTKNGNVDMYQLPLTVPRLVDMCRKVVNHYIDQNSINKLQLPSELKKFILYENIREQTSAATTNKTTTSSCDKKATAIIINSTSLLTS